MAILFDDASSEYLTIASAPVVGTPLTISCWFYSDDATALQSLVSLKNSGAVSGQHRFTLSADGSTGGDPVLAQTGDGSSFSNAATSSGYSTNTWHHACGVFTSATDRAAFIDGGSKGTSTTSRTPSGIDTTNIGRNHTSSFPMSGRIAEVAIYNVALSDAEVALLAMGFSPLMVRPESLVFYLPMIALGSTAQLDWIGGLTMTEANTPATAAHPPNIVYPPWVMGEEIGFPSIVSALSVSLRYTTSMTATPLAAMYRIFSSSVPRTTFTTRED